MPYIMNTLDDKITTQAHGKYFTWQPGEIKNLHNQKLADFLSQLRGEEGLMEVPERVMELDKNSPEFKKELYEIRKAGIAKFIKKQNWIVRNLEMSLRRDYETSGQKGNFLFEAGKGELAAYHNLEKYKQFEAKEHLNVADEIQKMREKLYGTSDSSDPGTVSEGRPSPIKPTQG